MTIEVREVAPCDSAVAQLIESHLSLMRASSPACSTHAMNAEKLSETGARFFAAFDGSLAVAMGALMVVAPGHGELKSMHVVRDRRGEGLAQLILGHLTSVAQAEGLTRLSLETGSQEAFAPARACYGQAGFDTCPPFGAYTLDPNSVFMTRLV